ncbi:SusC/RagA family TonB-linked outer membrane protein [Pinibacter soli]|uniref:SusC/RagA family TonB-linked outer membrane protein n=1 Tax=Pinibacter soli TaxID=3044211 RepID=A0ABT6RB97_9BACT|nr:SusC/RagA family TonB-linked outer membrane protein [Pinibacter soli]MDI3319804.1 SusC/RagA family TonB-linked outer membrane protein [Pinibacter soli]
MRITVFLLLAFALQTSAKTFSQNVTLNMRNAPLIKVLDEVEKQTGYSFIYEKSQLAKAGAISIDVKNCELQSLLEKVLKNQPLNFNIREKFIVLSPKPNNVILSQPTYDFAYTTVKGKVVDENDKPIVRASVVVKSGNAGTFTDKEGNFQVAVLKIPSTLMVSCIGFIAKEVQVNDVDFVTIKLHPRTQALNEAVVSTGMFTRRKETFTGASTTVTGEDLKRVGNKNLLESLKSLDPSFVIVANNKLGSDPNSMPNIEIRGKSSIAELSGYSTNANLPLFILDGFEAPLSIIVDLDMERVASVTILKDAASTALYGAKAANGVVVVETTRPKEGKLRLSVSQDIRVENPDLTVYNLMNAEEKLQFEKLSGRYTSNSSFGQLQLDQVYNKRLTDVTSGVNTYWLNEPVKTAITSATSLNISGGDQSVTYGIGVNYRSQPGVMKGSNRNTYGGKLALGYRKGKLNISNNFTYNSTSGNQSPYGSFSDYASANPYYKKNYTNQWLDNTVMYDDFGIPTFINVTNPLYNAVLPYKNASTNASIANNLSVIYDITSGLRFNGGLQYATGTSDGDIFISPDNTKYINTPVTQKGSYTSSRSKSSSYTVNGMLSYGKIFARKHSLTANIRGEVSSNYSTSNSFTAIGFPSGSNPVLTFASSYDLSQPSGSTATYRTVNALSSLNYVYDGRYFIDATYRTDGSTVFGKKNRFSGFWAVGIGWNVNREKFLSNVKWLNRLKLFSNLGITGNQNFGSALSTSVYKYYGYSNQFGLGSTINQLANPGLQPQSTAQWSSGLDFVLFNNRLSGYLQAYTKKTNNLLVSTSRPPSTGVSNYQQNLGGMNGIGFEWRVAYEIISDRKNRKSWTLSIMGSNVRNKYFGFNHSLDGLNSKYANTLTRFKDGYSPDAIWTVKSLGIDPATGHEVFEKADGTHTFEYNQGYLGVMGNTNPFAEGVISNTAVYKNLSLSIIMRYRIKADVFNSALFNKVENISYQATASNQDKRSLYDRWQKPGDVVQFKAISLTDVTQMSSRFIQEENTLTCESINVNYTFRQKPWMKKLGMSSLVFSAYGNDIFRISTIKFERGTDYPFARAISFSLRASF